jgi:hypothetical protein
LSHGPAGQLLWLVDRDLEVALHVTLPERAARSPRGIIIHRPVNFLPCDGTTRRGIPVTTPTRTVWDLAACESPRIARRAFERAHGRGELDRSRLGELLRADPSHRGSRLLRTLLSEASMPLAAVRSWLEQLALHVCGEHGLPPPAVNVPLLGYEADLLWERERFVVEADGGEHLTMRQRDKDNERDIAFGRAGYLVRRYSSAAMKREREVAEEIRSILVERSGGSFGSGS